MKREIEIRTMESVAHVSINQDVLKHGHTDATFVCDSTRGVVLDVGQVTGKKDMIALLAPLFLGIQDKVETVSTNMSKTLIEACKIFFPQAILIHNKFYLTQHLNQSINKVGQREKKMLPKELRGVDFASLKSNNNPSKSQEETFKAIKDGNLEVGTALQLRDNFNAIYHCKSYKKARKNLDNWINSVEKTHIQEMTKTAKMFNEYSEGVCNALWHPQSNANIERLIGGIQRVQSTAKGYRNFERFRVAILFYLGGLDLSP